MKPSERQYQTDDIVSFDPATGRKLGTVPAFSAEDVQEAVNRSREAFNEWKKSSFAERKSFVMKAREVILNELDDIADLISRETGKPRSEAIAMEIAPVLDLMQWVARNAERMLRPKRIGLGLYGLMGRSSKVSYRPLGVVGIIPAWNYPFSIPLGEAVMALMAGNTVIIKPSELTPLVGQKIGDIFDRSDLPDDVVQVITGGGATGAALVSAGPDKIMFTGSVATGKKILAAAAEKMVPVVLELGGKDAMIVFDDANIELAAEAAVWAAFANSGQSCCSVERLYVQRNAAEKLSAKIIEKTGSLKQGVGNDPTVSIGSMSSERQISIVEDHIREFEKAGAKIMTGGKRNSSLAGLSSGENLFYEPTVITGANNRMRPMQEETFGPTLPIVVFDTEEEAIALANDSEFGLTASVWTRDRSRGRRVAYQIEAGTVTINDVMYTHGIGQTPWGGFKNSGRGRTHGIEGLMELVQPQHIHTNHFPLLPNAWWLPYSPSADGLFHDLATRFASGSLFKTSLMLPKLMRRTRELLKLRKGEK
ncbi:MAG: aldehyde dehydrogenase family protein [Acidobacteria bacterium]|nr:aldehyde dehydrogenase family protein [Acidobacteriota bacterium]